MRVGVIGTGNMGKRRIACLQELGEHEIVAFDLHDGELAHVSATYDVGAAPNLDYLWEWGPEAVIISTPPRYHLHCALQARASGVRGIFVEKPLALAMPSAEELATFADCVTMVGCPWRFAPGLVALKRWMDEPPGGGVVGGTFQGHYPLAEVRPDYLSSYVPSTGVLLDVGSHLLDLALDWFGPARLESAEITSAARIGLPQTDGEAILVLCHANGLFSKVWVDFFSRYEVGASLSGDGWLAAWEYMSHAPGPEMYLRETEHFLASVRDGQPTCNDFRRASDTLALLLEARAKWQTT